MRAAESIRSEVWRRRFLLRDGGLALLVLATVALVAAVLTGGGDTSTLVSSTATDPGSAFAPREPADDSPTPEPSPTPAALSPSTVTTLPSASPTAAPTPARATTRPAAAPRFPGAGLRLDVTARATGPLSVEATVRVRDTDGSWNGGYIAFGDGKRQEFGRNTPRCATTSAPGKAAPSDVTRSFRHTYGGAGDYRVVVHVRTERSCSGAPVEEISRTVRVRVTGKSGSTATSTPSPRPTEQPSPDPTGPDPTPTGEPSPEPTPEQTFAPRPR